MTKVTGGRNTFFEGPKTWPSGPERPEKKVFGQDPSFSRGYIKLKDISAVFKFDFRNKTVLDIGSSTGGFTKYALEKGAKKVIAIEKGTNQMEAPLRYDERIELHEKTDFFTFENFKEKIDVILADISFMSLKTILEHAKKINKNSETEYLVMLKPQFEAKKSDLNKGIVKNEKTRREIIKNFEFWLKQNNFVIIKKRDNELKGKHGNVERFYWLKVSKS
ncbi:TlyA family RNA methyltransferase [Candidatus Saccharibacteria bacterium]|nr:TlyA family RNA methyltransferase [Candidatus Saccharibacteria bacterium]